MSSMRSSPPPARAIFERLITVLDPDILLRADGGRLASPSRFVRRAQAVAAQAATFSRLGWSNQGRVPQSRSV